MKTVSVLAAGALALGAFALSAPLAPTAAAQKGGSSTTPTCRKGLAWDKRRKKCVRAKKSSGLSDRNWFEVARDFAYRGRYGEALDVLSFVENADADVLTYRGFATRKLGDVEGGMKLYYAALAMDPDNVITREYLGEAYLTLGRVEDARGQLAEIERLCGTDCAEYGLLDRAIERHLAG